MWYIDIVSEFSVERFGGKLCDGEQERAEGGDK